MTYFIYSLQGRRESNEDQHYVFENLNGQDKSKAKLNLYCVFDGHGGKLVSKYLRDNLPDYFTYKDCEKNLSDKNMATKYFKKVFDKLQEVLEINHPKASAYCGSTCNICIITKPKNKENNYIYVANLGDSRSVISKKGNIAKSLSIDHKPNLPKEKERIQKLGGSIRYDGSDWRVNDLSLSRAFGDNDSKPYVSHRPDIFKHKVLKEDNFLVVGCDGLWDVLSNQLVCDYIRKLKENNYKGNYAKKLAEYAFEKGSYDNISVIVKFL
jgi:serine/threonine protein phosphatase PrpC